MKYTAMVINRVFEGESLLIIKSKGEEVINRFDRVIVKEELDKALERQGVPIDNCKIIEVSRDYKDSVYAEEF